MSDMITGFIYLGAAALSGHWLPFALLGFRGIAKIRDGWEEIRYYTTPERGKVNRES